MATEIGGISLGGSTKAAEHAIADFFKGFDGSKPFTEFSSGVKGKQVFKDDAGNTFASFSGKKVKLTAGEPSVVDGAGKKVTGSKGDDKVLVADDIGHKLTGGKGNDAVTLSGGGNNKVDGGVGNDTMTVAGAGDNTLKGGKGSDTFVFTEGATGDNVIKDFKAGDVLKIADRTGDHVVKEGEDFTMAKADKDTVITLKDGGTITLKKVDATKLSQNQDTAGSSDDDGIFHL